MGNKTIYAFFLLILLVGCNSYQIKENNSINKIQNSSYADLTIKLLSSETKEPLINFPVQIVFTGYEQYFLGNVSYPDLIRFVNLTTNDEGKITINSEKIWWLYRFELSTEMYVNTIHSYNNAKVSQEFPSHTELIFELEEKQQCNEDSECSDICNFEIPIHCRWTNLCLNKHCECEYYCDPHEG